MEPGKCDSVRSSCNNDLIVTWVWKLIPYYLGPIFKWNIDNSSLGFQVSSFSPKMWHLLRWIKKFLTSVFISRETHDTNGNTIAFCFMEVRRWVKQLSLTVQADWNTIPNRKVQKENGRENQFTFEVSISLNIAKAILMLFLLSMHHLPTFPPQTLHLLLESNSPFTVT